MFADFTLDERKLWLATAEADRSPDAMYLAISSRFALADHLHNKEKQTKAAQAIAACTLIPDQRIPQLVEEPYSGKKVLRSEAQKYLRNWYRECLDVADVSLRYGFPTQVLLYDGDMVDSLKFLKQELEDAEADKGGVACN